MNNYANFRPKMGEFLYIDPNFCLIYWKIECLNIVVSRLFLDGDPGNRGPGRRDPEVNMGLIDLMRLMNDPDIGAKIEKAAEKIEYYAVLIELVAERLDITQAEIEDRVKLKTGVRDNGEMQKM